MYINDKNLLYKKKAFTLVEIMLLLVVFSLILAASFSVITRKHKLRPVRSAHGQYICFYDKNAGKNYEILYSGSTLMKQGHIDDKYCTFTIPESASYLHIRMMGGGGAGGNANYNPYKFDLNEYVREEKAISLVRSYKDEGDDTIVRPKVWGEGDEYNSMGVKADYVNNKFKNVNGVPLFTADLFSYLVRTYIVDKVFAYDYAGDGESGWGFEASGIDYSKHFCKGDTEGHSDSGGYSQYYTNCLHSYLTNTYSDDNPHMPMSSSRPSILDLPKDTCIAALYKQNKNISIDDIRATCPEILSQPSNISIQPYLSPRVQNAVFISGSKGGKGSVIVSATANYSLDTYPIVGWRWPYYGLKSGDGEPLDLKYTGSLNETEDSKYRDMLYKLRERLRYERQPLVRDWVQYAYISSAKSAPYYEPTALIPGQLITDCTGENCFYVPNGTKYLKNNNYSYDNPDDGMNPIPELVGADFDFTKIHKPTFGDANGEGGDLKDYLRFIDDGGLPYYPSNTSYNQNFSYSYNMPSGITLNKLLGSNSPNTSNVQSHALRDIISGSASKGKAGKNACHKRYPQIGCQEDDVIPDFRNKIWDNYGSNENFPGFDIQSGADGNTKFDQNKRLPSVYVSNYDYTIDPNSTELNYLYCLPNLGFLFKTVTGQKTVDLHVLLGLSSITGGAYKFLRPELFMCYDNRHLYHEGEENYPNERYKPIEYKLDENRFSLAVMLSYDKKSISYGEPGQSGEYKEFFTRTYKSNTFHIIPGEGGEAVVFVDSNSHLKDNTYAAAGSEQQGKATKLLYNCDDQGMHCSEMTVNGGRGGNSGLKDLPEFLTYKPLDIYNFVKDNYTKLKAGNVKCSSNAPNDLDVPGCEGNGSYKSEDTKFQNVAPLLNLPDLENIGGDGFSLKNLGKGGDGGWARDNCWFIPQYFSIYHFFYGKANSSVLHMFSDFGWNTRLSYMNYDDISNTGYRPRWTDQGATNSGQQRDIAHAEYDERSGILNRQLGSGSSVENATLIRDNTNSYNRRALDMILFNNFNNRQTPDFYTFLHDKVIEDKCRVYKNNGTSEATEKAYYNEPGKDGMPGAVVITW